MKKLVRESLYESLDSNSGVYTPESEDDKKYLNETIQKINDFSSFSEVKEYVFEMTCGHHFPFNPPEPLRSVFRSKLHEMDVSNTDDEILKTNLLSMVSGEWKSIDLPPGAMY